MSRFDENGISFGDNMSVRVPPAPAWNSTPLAVFYPIEPGLS
jgi:hypothetical protein